MNGLTPGNINENDIHTKIQSYPPVNCLFSVTGFLTTFSHQIYFPVAVDNIEFCTISSSSYQTLIF